VKIPCADEREFRERFAPKYVANGIFVPSREPKPVGTRVRIKLELRTGVVLVVGDAMVTSRTTPDKSDKPGMTMRITALHPESIKFDLSPHGAKAATPAPSAAMPALTPAPPPLAAALTPAPPPRGAAPAPASAAPPIAAPALTPPPRLPSAPRAAAREDLFDFGDESAREPELAPATAPPPSKSSGEKPAPAPILFEGSLDEVTPEPSAVEPPSAPPPSAARGGRRLAILIAAAVAVALLAATALAVARRGPAPADASAARASAELRIADQRLREGRLAGAGGDSALDHLLAAKGAAPGDPRVAARLSLLAEKFELLGASALARRNLGEAAVHLDAALRADPARESARKKLAELEAAKSPGSAQAR
jgi:hypothetical protein